VNHHPQAGAKWQDHPAPELPVFDAAFARQFLAVWRRAEGTDEIDRMANNRTTISEEGQELQMSWGLSPRYGKFLFTLVKMFRPRWILEVGMANGVSSAYIAKAQLSYLQQDGAHVIIDPFQSTQWHNAGRAMLERLGLDRNIEVIENYSICVIPSLEKQGQRFDFVFIDGNHCLDYTLADVLASDRVLRIGGLIVLDDSYAFGVRMAVPYLDRYRVNLTRIRFDNWLVHWWREHISGRRSMTVYQKNSEDVRGSAGT